MKDEFALKLNPSKAERVEEMRSGEEVLAMVRLHEVGWGSKRIAQELSCARNTVRRYLREGGVASYRQPARRTAFDGLDDWLRERFFRHDGNADVLCRELASEHGIELGVRHWRRELKAQKRATVRFETAPGHQMQIDFGDTSVWIGGERVRIHVFVATLGYSRRLSGLKGWKGHFCGLGVFRRKRYRKLLQLLTQSSIHIIFCSRAKQPMIEDGHYDTRLRDELGAALFKCPSDLRCYFDGSPPTVALGAKIAEWVGGVKTVDSELERLLIEGQSAAADGSDAYRAWAKTLKNLTPAHRAELGKRRENWDSEAAADAEKARLAELALEAGEAALEGAS